MIAIHTKSGSFAPEWIAYCRENEIPYREVDCSASDIMQQLRGCRALLWHWPHHDYSAQLFARQLVASVEEMGVNVFPSTATCWHYDDKVGQKYLLEAIGAPLIPTHVFYDRATALEWVEKTAFPKVWKLRGGAGAQNVQLVKTRQAARKIVKKSFGAGWKTSRFHPLQERIWHFRRDRSLRSFVNIGRGIVRAILPHPNNNITVPQKGYVYFQDFAPDNDCDIRVVVIGSRAYAFKRMVREGDFRASGSGAIVYDRAEIPIECVRIAFDVTASLRSQSCAFDFVRIAEKWFVVEISYAFTAHLYNACPGYWDRTLAWHAAPVTPERFMLEDLLEAVGMGKAQHDGR